MGSREVLRQVSPLSVSVVPGSFAAPNLTLIWGLLIDHSEGDCKRQQHLAFAHGLAGDCGKRLRARLGIYTW